MNRKEALQALLDGQAVVSYFGLTYRLFQHGIELLDEENKPAAFLPMPTNCYFSAEKENDLDRYQRDAMRTHVDDPIRWAVYALGIGGESGEVAEVVEDGELTRALHVFSSRIQDRVKKVVGHGHELNREALLKELGDVLWYIAGLAHLSGFKLSDVAAQNIWKLQRRYPQGFSSEASINRDRATNEAESQQLSLPLSGHEHV